MFSKENTFNSSAKLHILRSDKWSVSTLFLAS